jgi:hypothetical protein
MTATSDCVSALMLLARWAQGEGLNLLSHQTDYTGHDDRIQNTGARQWRYRGVFCLSDMQVIAVNREAEVWATLSMGLM